MNNFHLINAKISYKQAYIYVRQYGKPYFILLVLYKLILQVGNADLKYIYVFYS